MSQTFRLPQILDIARKEGMVTVEELADRFGVTLQTIRRDLTELSDAGRLERVHGGAVLPSGVSNIAYEERRSLNAAAKAAIARACAQHIPEDASVFLNIGTSTEAVAHELQGHKNLLVVTNNLNVAQILSRNADCRTVLTGGTLRQADNGLIGNLAIETIQQFRFDIAVVGCSALDEDGEMLDFDIEEVGVSQAIIDRSRKVFVVADQSKFQRNAPVRIASLSTVDLIFTDAPLPGSLPGRCADWQTDVVICGAD
ncbi:DeoR/GlpR family DNA-binding transcription regulator [Thalassococcus sp. BH17M4-6]|uniref:DeoR/GlpR family DNA-binding transcription regulator n=1 Tax=Thalassococcus sp. BH17M4-6 TaxID=3413148 RepID=UPI003BC9A097